MKKVFNTRLKMFSLYTCRSPNEGKGSRSEAEDSGSKSRVDRARRKTVGPLLKPAGTGQQTKNPSSLSSRPSSTPAEPIVEIAEAELVPDLPEGRTLLEVFFKINLAFLGLFQFSTQGKDFDRHFQMSVQLPVDQVFEMIFTESQFYRDWLFVSNTPSEKLT